MANPISKRKPQNLIQKKKEEAKKQREKKKLLANPVKHIDITQFDARPLLAAMAGMSFTARDLARACEIFERALQEENGSVFLSLAGSSSAAGCLDLYRDLIRYNMVDAVIATGAAIIDMDFFEALGFKHYQGQVDIRDQKLRSLQIDRIYDTYINEEDLQICDQTLCDIASDLEAKPWSSRAFIQTLGRWLSEGNAVKKGSLIEEAYRSGVPVFCPAFSDSSAGFGLVKHQVERQKQNKPYLSIDCVADFREVTEVKIAAGTTGLLIVGGGTPKNFIQDTVVCAEILGHEVEMHKYAIQITVADPRDGACSSSTLKEACSWGKVDTAYEQMVFGEATSLLPLLVSNSYHLGSWKQRKKRRWAEKLFQEEKNLLKTSDRSSEPKRS